MKKKLYPFTSSAWIALGLALGLWLDGTVPAAGQQSPVQQPVRYSTANQTLSAPVRVSFNPPAAPNSAQNPKYTVQGRQVRQAGSSSGKMKFAFSNKHDQQWEVPANPVIPTQPHPNQIAAKRRQLGRQGNPGRQTASIPYRSPILAPNIPAQTLQVSTQPRQVRQAAQTPVQAPNSRQYIQVPQQSQASPRAIVPTPRLFNEAMASGQYDGYLVVSDQEYMLMQQGRMPQIDPSRVHSFAYYSKTRQPSSLGANTGMTSYSPVADYEDMLDRMEFSLAKLPRSPHAVELSPPSAASVWTRFFTGQQSDEIRSWKNNYVELVQHRRIAPSKQRFDDGPASPDTMIAQVKPVKPVEMKRLRTPTPQAGQEEVRLVSGEVTRDMLPEYHAPQPLQMEDKNDQTAQPSQTTDEPVSGGKMKVYRPED